MFGFCNAVNMETILRDDCKHGYFQVWLITGIQNENNFTGDYLYHNLVLISLEQNIPCLQYVNLFVLTLTYHFSYYTHENK